MSTNTYTYNFGTAGTVVITAQASIGSITVAGGTYPAYAIISVSGSFDGFAITGLVGTGNTVVFGNPQYEGEVGTPSHDDAIVSPLNGGGFNGEGFHGLDGYGVAFALSNGQTIELEGTKTDYEDVVFTTGSLVSLQYPTLQSFSTTACYCEGTLILTERGEVPVEDLCDGEHVVTLSGETRPVIWLGHRHVDCRRHPNAGDVWPVRVRADAFAPGRPHSDLWLSPDHAVFAADVLIPIKHLINGATIVQERHDAVTYWHVELGRHDVLLAEGLPCESFLDTGNRAAFENCTVTGIYASFDRDADGAWRRDACAPLVEDGRVVATLWQQLADRAAALGHDLPVVAEVEILAAGRITARLPARAAAIRIVSPAYRRGADLRRLGALIRSVRVDGTDVAVDNAEYGRGFHEVEMHGVERVRWTDGAALIFIDAANVEREIEIDVASVVNAAKDEQAA